MSLKEYNSKRKFDNTSEPKGIKKVSDSNRFVVQYHQARAKHYDFRLEHSGVLISWAVPKGLSTSTKDKRLAVLVEDHPVDYIDFEGIIPKGNYGAGTVEIFDKGNYLPIEDLDKGLKKGHIKIVLNGEKLKGGWSIIRTNENNWLIVKMEDEFVGEDKSKRNTKLPFRNSDVQLATLSRKIPSGKDWVFEIKHDGYRIVSEIENGKVKLLTRNKNDYTEKFSSITKSLKKLSVDSCILDGEVVVLDDKGRSDFGLLQESIKKKQNDFVYMVFDILALSGEDLRNETLKSRKSKLERLLYKAEKNIIYSSHIDKGKETFKFAKDNNLEGIIAKNLNSTYTGKRTEDWLKIKCYLRQEFVIVGYTISSKNELISALLLGYYDKAKLIFAGKVGTGFNESIKKELHSAFQKIIRKTSPLKEEISIKNVIWLKPELVAEIQYAEFTKEGLLRQPSYLGLRKDKKPKDVVLEVSK